MAATADDRIGVVAAWSRYTISSFATVFTAPGYGAANRPRVARRAESTPTDGSWWTVRVDDFEDRDYGDAIADVYDSWYADLTDVDATVAFLRRFVQDGPVLELGVGTGRLALPLAAAGFSVHGIDVSEGMLARLRAKDPDTTITTSVGDMVDDLPPGPFDLVFVAYNTFFNVRDVDRQRRLFTEVARRLTTSGAFVIEAFVPDPDRPGGDSVSIRSMTTDAVVLRADRHDPTAQVIDGQLIEITETGGVRLRPYRIRYASPAELDDMARAAGLVLTERWENTRPDPYDDESPSHVSVYRRT
jgi:SAM-dependent methyltransferase